jgi:hypothetical protein
LGRLRLSYLRTRFALLLSSLLLPGLLLLLSLLLFAGLLLFPGLLLLFSLLLLSGLLLLFGLLLFSSLLFPGLLLLLSLLLVSGLLLLPRLLVLRRAWNILLAVRLLVGLRRSLGIGWPVYGRQARSLGFWRSEGARLRCSYNCGST